jgi:hypothetical protein
MMLFVYCTRLRLVAWLISDYRQFLLQNPVDESPYEAKFNFMFKLAKLYVILNLAEYAMTFTYFSTVSIFYRKFHNAQGYCRARKTYMMVIWMFNILIQFFGLWIVFGRETSEIIKVPCMDILEADAD